MALVRTIAGIAALGNEPLGQDRGQHPEGKAGRDQVHLAVAPTHRSRDQREEREQQDDGVDAEVAEPADQKRKRPERQADRDEVELAPAPTNRGKDERDKGEEYQQHANTQIHASIFLEIGPQRSQRASNLIARDYG